MVDNEACCVGKLGRVLREPLNPETGKRSARSRCRPPAHQLLLGGTNMDTLFITTAAAAVGATDYPVRLLFAEAGERGQPPTALAAPRHNRPYIENISGGCYARD